MIKTDGNVFVNNHLVRAHVNVMYVLLLLLSHMCKRTCVRPWCARCACMFLCAHLVPEEIRNTYKTRGERDYILVFVIITQ